MQVNSIGGQNFGSLNTKKCAMFAKELKNSDVLQRAAKKYNITAIETNNLKAKSGYAYNIVLNIQEKSKGLINKLMKKGNKGTITIQSDCSLRPGKIMKAIKELQMSDIEKSVAKSENVVKNVESSPVARIFRDADLNFRFKKNYGMFPKEALEDGVDLFFQNDKVVGNKGALEYMQKALKSEIELRYLAEMGLI